MDIKGKRLAIRFMTIFQLILLCGLNLVDKKDCKQDCTEKLWLDINPWMIGEIAVLICSILVLFLIVAKCFGFGELTIDRCYKVVLGLNIVIALTLIYPIARVYKLCSDKLFNFLYILTIGDIICIPFCAMHLYFF